MARNWEADPSASFTRRLGKSASELDISGGRNGCPDLWQLDNGDVAIIGRDLTDHYRAQLPADASIAADERLVVVPGVTMSAAKPDIPDARA